MLKNISWRVISPVILYGLLVLISCQGSGNFEVSSISMRTSLAIEGPCPEQLTLKPFSEEITEFRVTVSADDMNEALILTSKGDSLTIADVPAGENRRLLVEGLVKQRIVWRAFRSHISIEAGQNHKIDMMLTKVSDMSCARGVMFSRRAFHTATQLLDGTVLIAGGASTSDTCGVNQCFEATIYAELYNPFTGEFIELPNPMHRGRIFHTATLLKDGRVLFVGGSQKVELTPVGLDESLPIEVTQATTVMEIYNPETQKFSIVSEDSDPRAFHSALRLEDGRVWITGGISGMAAEGKNDLHHALNTTSICDSSVKVCQKFTDLEVARAGHSSFLLEDGTAYILGGAIIDNASESEDDIVWAEQLFQGASKSRVLNIKNWGAEQNLFFAKAEVMGQQQIVVTGGLSRTKAGHFAMATDSTGEKSRFSLITKSTSSSSFVAESAETAFSLNRSKPLFFHQATLMGADRLMLSGGFENLDFEPSSRLTLFDVKNKTLSPISLSGESLVLKEARSGHRTLYLEDGTLVIFGGISGSFSAQGIKQSAEIFNDPFFRKE